MTEKPVWHDLYYTAKARGDVEILRAAIAAGMPLNERCLNGAYTPLHYIAEWGGKAVLMKALIEAGADLNVRVTGSSAGSTALMFAAKKGRLDLVRLLLAAGADVHATDELGSNALGQTAFGGVSKPKGASKLHTAIFRALLDAGCKPDAQTLLYAAWGGNPDIVRMTLEAGIGPNEPSRLGLPLNWAIANKKYLGNAELLLEAGADPDLRATSGQFKGCCARELTGKNKAAAALLDTVPRKAPTST